MFCPDERPPRASPSTLYLGGVGTTLTVVQPFTDYLTQADRTTVEFIEAVAPTHDDLFDFFYRGAAKATEEVGQAAIDTSTWLKGQPERSGRTDFRYDHATNWGRKMFVSPASSGTASCSPTALVAEINLGIRPYLSGDSSYYEDWEEQEDVRAPRPAG